MGKNHRGSRSDSEFTENQRLKYENQKLKRQISKLRKELSRIDIDRYTHLKDLIEAQDAEVQGFDKVHELSDLKAKWICHGCKEDYLRVVIVPRADGMFYLRRCPTCKHKTKLKKYTEGVDGIGTDGNPVTSSEIP